MAGLQQTAARPSAGITADMSWTAPHVTRIDEPFTGPGRGILDGFLDWHRSTLLFKCAGLTGEQLARGGGAVEPVAARPRPVHGRCGTGLVPRPLPRLGRGGHAPGSAMTAGHGLLCIERSRRSGRCRAAVTKSLSSCSTTRSWCAAVAQISRSTAESARWAPWRSRRNCADSIHRQASLGTHGIGVQLIEHFGHLLVLVGSPG